MLPLLIARDLLGRMGRASPPAELRPDRLDASAGLTVYVHLPFCASRCRYCGFNLSTDPRLVQRYLAALERELAQRAALPWQPAVEVTSVYLGGGTPSLLPAADLARVLAALRAHLTLRPGLQITLEANPESVDAEKLAACRAAGVSRVSLGVQSFDDACLERLGRRHRAAGALRALDALAEAGLREVSIDLMYGLPGQSARDLERDLARAVAAPVTHVSLFPLATLPGTTLGRHRPRAGRTRALWQLYALASRTLEAAGFEQYTSEDFTRSGVRCDYQMDTWRPPLRGCLGLGAGALSLAGGFLWHNGGPLEAYLDAPRPAGVLRGVRLSALQQRAAELYGALKCLRLEPRHLEGWGPVPLALRAAGLARAVPDRALELTPRGRFLVSLYWTRMILGKLAAVQER